ncbi:MULTISPECIES: 50S ribosomal protein L25/general stress protein Ctc [Acidiphilium]|jgi:large subunit ribosomal protein L25|uniref:Large ribosomal subunit protein bL25 n=1 Tax=Acidiphilium rubrum TaxID=526 RepID=A0A8G2CMM2_ACIRU|nr:MULTISPECIES: 50S ribosomal protein L25/general stress protein Ctc [Acidiphilium]OYW03549.1 MAG: 50S ribosomal protein L25/general stress protein Ctc [Acidiphilium sp. 37-64-53]OZB29508.1 MAG: 50S ribosomal protein L25/general stress protein Ctc [Acidiphilium sp. 34-64-41]SIR26767.1 large subunit ribosomal protein L25 [Acidiphilium rubrum]HQT84199.1 50S ribosomal protein L25/general stress protein Ctc [Acidiphilium rubrum]
MANFETIAAEDRARAGKGVARATRRAGMVPGVIYGAKQDPSLIAIDPRVVMRELKRGGWRSRLYEIETATGKTRALMRDVQFHPVTDQPEHIDFQRLAVGEPVRVAVAVNFMNELLSVGMKRGGVLNVVRHSVEVWCDPDTIPDHFEADLGPLDINDNIRWHDLKGTEKTRPTIIDRDFVVATVAAPTVIAEAAPEPGAAPAAAPAKGGKGGPAKAAAPAAKAAPAKAAAKPAAKK